MNISETNDMKARIANLEARIEILEALLPRQVLAQAKDNIAMASRPTLSLKKA